MIKLQNPDVLLSTLYAWMAVKVVKDKVSISFYGILSSFFDFIFSTFISAVVTFVSVLFTFSTFPLETVFSAGIFSEF